METQVTMAGQSESRFLSSLMITKFFRYLKGLFGRDFWREGEDSHQYFSFKNRVLEELKKYTRGGLWRVLKALKCFSYPPLYIIKVIYVCVSPLFYSLTPLIRSFKKKKELRSFVFCIPPPMFSIYVCVSQPKGRTQK